MNKIRIGLIGCGSMGNGHAKYLATGEVPNVELTAICDVSVDNLNRTKENLGTQINVELFCNAQKLLESGSVDAVLIATPHYDHPKLVIAALENGLHVLLEKPAGVYTKDVHRMNAIATKSDKVFGIMFNQRTHPIHQKLKDMISSDQLGEIKRTNWIITTWYRPQSYFDAGGWRATWAGEGGGVLLNQCPHQLDLWQWICGMPTRVRAFCAFGKYHNIEVEDDVTAYVEYENGATGVFITSTGETPGSNRLEIAGNNGKIVMEDNKLTFWKTDVPERQFNREFKDGFGEPKSKKIEIAIEGEAEGHKGITKNWAEAILNNTPLLAPGTEGIKSLELSNAMLLSSWQDDWVDLPIDDDLFYKKLREQFKNSTSSKDAAQNKVMGTEGTY